MSQIIDLTKYVFLLQKNWVFVSWPSISLQHINCAKFHIWNKIFKLCISVFLKLYTHIFFSLKMWNWSYFKLVIEYFFHNAVIFFWISNVFFILNSKHHIYFIPAFHKCLYFEGIFLSNLNRWWRCLLLKSFFLS